MKFDRKIKNFELFFISLFKDWELFVKSHNDSNDLSQIVEKVVFNLHESFPKPKRVIKEPPYVVKGKSHLMLLQYPGVEVIVYVFGGFNGVECVLSKKFQKKLFRDGF